MSSEESGPNEAARTLGRYQILETLRRGPITNWYRAEHDDLKRTVLLKALRSGILPSSPFAGALRREAALLTELAHPTILHLYDFVESEETLFLVMEDDDFWPLDQVMKRAATLSPSAVAALALQLTRALEHAHSHGIIHRDLQPNNIFITRLGASSSSTSALPRINDCRQRQKPWGATQPSGYPLICLRSRCSGKPQPPEVICFP